MLNRHIVVFVVFALAFSFLAPMPVVADSPPTGLEPLVNQWRIERGVSPLQGDERLYTAAKDVASDGTHCPQDQMYVEFAIAEALYRAGYVDRRGYGLVLCGQYPTPQTVIDWIRQRGGPSHPDLEHIGVAHLAGLDFSRGTGTHVSDIWVLLAADPMN